MFGRARLSLIAAILGVPAFSQAQSQFDVASIKRSDPAHFGAQTFFSPGGKFSAVTASVKSLVCFAYQLRPHQVAGGPAWFDTEVFDVSAKTEGPASYEQLFPMVQALLADRFQLRFHRETREQPVYALVLGRNGPKFQAAKSAGRGVGGGGKGRLSGNGADMATFASALSGKLGRSVLDRTGLKGVYDFLLTWTPDEEQATDPGLSLFTATQEQLGLKLESAKGPVEVLVIDHAERPSEN
jgi:uncharacterized protein (TIGR03435 family)